MYVGKKTFSLKFLGNLLLITAVLFLLSQFFLKNEKIAYVDSAKIINDYKGAESARKSYEKKVKTWQAKIDTLTLDVQSAIKKYERGLSSMSVQEQGLAKQLIVQKEQQLANYQRAIQENARQEDLKLTQGIVSQINAFLSRYGQSHNYKMILIANNSGTIAYAREGLDITADVVKELNQEYGKN